MLVIIFLLKSVGNRNIVYTINLIFFNSKLPLNYVFQERSVLSIFARKNM